MNYVIPLILVALTAGAMAAVYFLGIRRVQRDSLDAALAEIEDYAQGSLKTSRATGVGKKLSNLSITQRAELRNRLRNLAARGEEVDASEVIWVMRGALQCGCDEEAALICRCGGSCDCHPENITK